MINSRYIKPAFNLNPGPGAYNPKPVDFPILKGTSDKGTMQNRIATLHGRTVSRPSNLGSKPLILDFSKLRSRLAFDCVNFYGLNNEK